VNEASSIRMVREVLAQELAESDALAKGILT